MYIHLFYFIDDGKWLKWQMFIQKPYLCIYKIYKSPIFSASFLFFKCHTDTKKILSAGLQIATALKAFFYSFCALHCFFSHSIAFYVLFCTYFFWTNKFSIVLVELWQPTLLCPLIRQIFSFQSVSFIISASFYIFPWVMENTSFCI